MEFYWMCNANSNIDVNGRTLVESDEGRRIYLCENGIVHVKWGENNLVYCPGDVIGLSYLLTALKEQPCGMECASSENCPLDHGNGIVYLPYGSIKIPITLQECKNLHLMAKEAVEHLFNMKNNGDIVWHTKSAGVGIHAQPQYDPFRQLGDGGNHVRVEAGAGVLQTREDYQI
jgi:hypothetical protein